MARTGPIRERKARWREPANPTPRQKRNKPEEDGGNYRAQGKTRGGKHDHIGNPWKGWRR